MTRKFLDRYDCIDVGDWVRFMAGGEPVIAEVLYITEEWPPQRVVLYTTAGSTTAEGILEVRQKSEPPQ